MCIPVHILPPQITIHRPKPAAGKDGVSHRGGEPGVLDDGMEGPAGEVFLRPRREVFIRSFQDFTAFQAHGIVCGGAAGNKFLFSNENKLVTLWMPDNMHKVFPSSFHHTTCNGEPANKVRKLLPQFLKPEALRRYVDYDLFW
ncbi:hypothetical protein PIB30_023995 [Stylosanthes scabra]|uniref:Uncharacterized protein n=1 Tax=Stylosanthes scabra TaxID=79078 RepID=A0ABU6Y6S4_9FABA|nr:hypothetical protein [Stylosanthes scabra]